MRICIFGAGAIGGTLGVRLAQSGHEVSLVARGAHLAAIRASGLTLLHGEVRHNVRLAASDNPAHLGVQDLVVIAMKSHSLPGAVDGLAPLIGPDTVVLTTMNGIPWWFFDAWGGTHAGLTIKACDPIGRIGRAVAPAQVVGGVVFMAADVPEPGVVRHNSGNRLVIGEPAHQPSARVATLATALCGAGFEGVASDNIRRDIWLKLLGNLCFNPVSVLTGASTDLMLADSHMCGLFAAMMREAMALAAALGLEVNVDPEKRMDQTRKLGAIKSSMLQDAEAGRPIELDAIVGSVVEIAEHVGVPMPFVNAVYGTLRVRASKFGLYPKP